MAEASTEKVSAEWLLKRHARLTASRSGWDSFWQDVASYVMPRKAEILTSESNPSTSRQDVLFDSTAIRSNQILGNGQLTLMTPSESIWFSFEPPMQLKGIDKVDQWYKRCSEIAAMEMAQSNFYTEIHELFLDRGGFGTACMFAREGKNTALNFENFTIASYCIDEDDEGNVDTLSRRFEMTLRQAAMKFGVENLSSDLQKKHGETSGKCLDDKFWFQHDIYPRGDYDVNKLGGKNMPIASVYCEVASKHVISEGGFEEQPFFATRYLKWGSSVYGWSPSWVALPEARQINFLEKNLDSLVDLAVNPRLLIPENLAGVVDLRPGGPTYFDPNRMDALPKEWATQGRYDAGEERSMRKKKAIEEAFHVDLFQMFAQIERQMTAREVSERAAEKLIQFSPTLARMTTELFNPMLKRVFSLLIRQGKFPAPPPEAIISAGDGQGYVDQPQVTYSSRIAMAIKNLENNAFGRSMEMILPLAAQRPDVLDNYDFDQIVRDLSRNDGMPERWMVQLEKVQEMRQQRAEQLAQQMQQEQMGAMADAAGKVGGIQRDSLVGAALEGRK